MKETAIMSTVRKTIAAGLAVATLSLGVAASSTPAAAWGYHHGGWRRLGLGRRSRRRRPRARRRRGRRRDPLLCSGLLFHPPAGLRRLWRRRRLSPYSRLRLIFTTPPCPEPLKRSFKGFRRLARASIPRVDRARRRQSPRPLGWPPIASRLRCGGAVIRLMVVQDLLELAALEQHDDDQRDQ